MDTITVFIADPQPLFRQGVRSALESEGGAIEVVGEADNGHDALEQAGVLAPDVMIIDLRLPGANGLEVTRSVKHTLPRTSVIILSDGEDEESLFQSIKLGAAAYFSKNVEPAVLAQGIRRINDGEYLINDNVLAKPMLASRVLKSFRELATVEDVTEPLFVPLSTREVEVLDYIARGNSNKEIARELHISDQTVKNHITSILRKLAVNDRTQAVVYALRRGWIKMGE